LKFCNVIEPFLKASDLDRVIVDPPILTNGSSLRSRIVPPTEKIGLRHAMSRAVVAAWMLGEAKQNLHLKGEVLLSS
jgi:hypothetical protein